MPACEKNAGLARGPALIQGLEIPRAYSAGRALAGTPCQCLLIPEQRTRTRTERHHKTVLFMELKNVHRDLRRAFDENLSDYKDTVPHIFDHNAIIVLGNGRTAKIGSLSSRYQHFREWKRLEEEEQGRVDMEILLKGVCSKANFFDIFENFILFDDSAETLVKIVAQNQQFLGVNRAVEAVKDRKARDGKLGVFWHTQGAGKSYSIAFFSRKVHRRVGGNFTFLILTDRDDLDKQIYTTFAGCGISG
jgi:type I restriction enzyme R subunit